MTLVDRLEDILEEIDKKRLSTARKNRAIRKLLRVIEDVEDGDYIMRDDADLNQKSLKQLLFVSKSLKKGSKAAKAWGAKMRRLRGGGKKRKKSTRKGQRRKTARRAYEGIKRKTRKSYKRRKSSSGMKMPKVPSVIKKVALGVGAASLAGMAVGLIAPQFSGIARPIAALAAGGIPGVAGELLINQGLLGNITGMFGAGAGINETRLASGL